ncbi:MAG TPA: hypothetical protein ENK06_00450 [Gammaproteobacteria bacterium]|nr:hypothetical protein [Gammaproteobacteria bacterium]
MRYQKKDILEMANGGFFGKGNAQLPSSMMLMIDEIEHITREGGRFGKGQLKDKVIYEASGLMVGLISSDSP